MSLRRRFARWLLEDSETPQPVIEAGWRQVNPRHAAVVSARASLAAARIGTLMVYPMEWRQRMSDVQDAVAKLNVRTYMVLCRTSPSEGWAEAGQYDGGSDLRAIRSAFEANGQQPVGAEWVAVPVRSWKPRKPQTKTTTSTIWDSVEDIRAAAGEPEEGET